MSDKDVTELMAESIQRVGQALRKEFGDHVIAGHQVVAIMAVGLALAKAIDAPPQSHELAKSYADFICEQMPAFKLAIQKNQLMKAAEEKVH